MRYMNIVNNNNNKNNTVEKKTITVFQRLYAKRNENYVSKAMLESWSRYDTSHFAQVDINQR